ncbi:MAG: hypothetical protein ABR532_02550 [Candidatus Dormibacteria bacterium]
MTEPGQTFPSPRVLEEWPADAVAVAEYHCTVGHVQVVCILRATEVFGRLRGIEFGEIRCPTCRHERESWYPPSYIRAIWWRPEFFGPPTQ